MLFTIMQKHKGLPGIVCGLLVVTLLGPAGHTTSAASRKPNIILILADDLGYETLGAYGSTSYKTPHLDKLASEGMRFTHAYSTPLCTPSRVQLMTGKYNFRNYIGFGLLDPAERTFGHLLQAAGYVTGIAGKWQLLGNEYQQHLAGGRRGTYPTEAGFGEYCLWQLDKHGTYFTRYKDPVISSNAVNNKTYKDGYGPDVFVNFVEAFMEKHRSEPFFLYYPMVLTHAPFQPTPDNGNFVHFDPAGEVNDTAYFGEMVTYMDTIVGRIHQKAKDLGIEDNTLILFVGDNGTDRHVTSRMNEKEIPGGKGYPTEYGTHVPFVAYWKGHIKPGQVNGNLIDFTDFLPSLMEAAQADIPDDFETDGISFYSQLVGEPSDARQWVFGHYDPMWGKFPFARYVHDKRWKLYENGEVYDLQKDPMEEKPLSKDRLSIEQRGSVEKFQGILNRLK